MLALVFGVLGAIPWRVWLIGGIVAVVGGAILYAHHEWITEGYNEAIQTIINANKASDKKADAGQLTVDQCYADPTKHWDRVNGVCVVGAGP